MKITNQQIINSRSALQKLLNSNMDIDLSWELSVIVDKANNVLKLVQTNLDKIKNKYFVDVEDKNDPTKKEKKNIDPDKYQNEFDQLMSIETDIKLTPIKYSDLKKNNIKLTPSDITNIKWLICKD